MAKVDLTKFLKKVEKLQNVSQSVMPKAYDFFKKITPKQSGNARRNTKLEKETIVAKYPYAQVLDEGRSKQAPDGMSNPTSEVIKKLTESYINKNGKAQ